MEEVTSNTIVAVMMNWNDCHEMEEKHETLQQFSNDAL